MLVRLKRALALAALIGAPFAGAAQAHGAYGDGLLPAPPADAPPGECYAHVRIPGQPTPAPPVVAGARWVLNPGPPGSPGPIWCLVPTYAYAPAPPPIEREGWIRVLCDRDATPDRIVHVQRELHDRGYYKGGYTGRYDEATAAAVGRFQSGAHIAHSGYLSVETLEALEGGYAYGGPAPAGQAYGYSESYGYEQSSAYGSSDYGYQTAYGPPVSPCLETCVSAPPPPPVYAPPPQPCCVQPPPPCCATPQGYPGYGYGGYGGGYGYGGPTPGYVAGHSAVVNGWLTWPGKSLW